MSIFERDFDREIAEERALARRRGTPCHTDEELQAALEAARAEGRAQGRAEGHAEGRAEAAAEAREAEAAARNAALERIATRLDEMLAQAAEHRQSLERQILGYAATTAETVLPEILETRAHARTLAQVRRGLRLGLDARHLQVALPAAAGALRDEVEALVAAQGLSGRVRITEEAALPPGDARISWEGGRLDYSFSRICAAIQDNLRASARPNPQTEDRS